MGVGLRASGRAVTIDGLKAGAVEAAALRWRHGACFDLPTGQRQYIVSGPMHYKDGGGNWQEIDNRWQPGTAPWDYQMVDAEYRAYLLKRFDAGQILRLEKAGHYLTYQPMGLNWTNDLSQIQPVAMPANVTGGVANTGSTSLCQQGRIDWSGGYGPGLDFAYIPSTHFFRKLLTIASRASLPTPEPYILAGGNPALELSFVFQTDLDLWVDGVPWDKKTATKTIERIEFKDGAGTVHWWWASPRAYDAKGDECPGTIQLKKQGASLYVSVHIPWAWLETAEYKVEIDPDTVYGSTDDGYIEGGGFFVSYANARATSTFSLDTQYYFWVGQTEGDGAYVDRGYWKFDTSGVSGSVINVTLTMTVWFDSSTTDFVTRIHKYPWAGKIGDDREALYDGALASDYDADWRTTAGMSTNTPYVSSPLTNAYINQAGNTTYALLSQEDVENSAPTGAERIAIYTQEAATPAYRPYLSITTEAPPAGTVARHVSQAYQRING